MEEQELPPLLSLPAELIQHVLSFLSPLELSRASKANSSLRTHASSDTLWQQHINSNLPKPITSSSPLPSFRDLFISLHPFWFLPKHEIWFSDSEASGKLIIARYDHRRGCIEAYAVVAEPGVRSWRPWEHDENVSIHSFNPKVQLDLNQPVLKLDAGCLSSSPSQASNGEPLSPLSREIPMDCCASPGLYESFMLSRDIPPTAIGPGTKVWPPRRLPAYTRTRNASTRGFESSGHKPSRHSEVSNTTFRLRKWMEFGGRQSSIMALQNSDRMQAAISLRTLFQTFVNGPGGSVRMGEEVSTFATLPRECYTPTPEKPYRGIWCGDYSGHGCEFLVILQPEAGEQVPLPAGMNHLLEWLTLGSLRRDSSSSSDSSFVSTVGTTSSTSATASAAASTTASASASVTASTSDAEAEYVPDRLEAVKLTGDPNVPRGEYTFIAPDISDKGLVRIADEEVFRGARVVRSAGHIAGQGFVEDEYISSNLVLLSTDCVAQYWITYGHISYYRRVDIDALLRL